MEAIELFNAPHAGVISSEGYRVRFWSVPEPGAAEALTEYRIAGHHEVAAVLEWAARSSGGRRVEVFVEHTEISVGRAGDEPLTILIQLSGTSATPSTTSTITFERTSSLEGETSSSD